MELKVVRYPGRIYKDPLEPDWTFDQLSNNPNRICIRFLGKYLYNNYRITSQQYYNLIVFGDINYVPKCPVCGADLTFRKFSEGYNQTCSRSCKATEENIRLNRSEQLNSTIANIKSKLTKFNNSGNPNDLCILYLTEDESVPNKLKYGITSDLSKRLYAFGSSYSNTIILVKDIRPKIAELECAIKLSRNNSDEYIPINEKDQLLDLINRLILARHLNTGT